MAGAWVLAELGPDGSPDPSALGLLTKARTLVDDVSAVVLGPGGPATVEVLGAYGARTVFISQDPVFAEFPGEPAAHVLAGLVDEHRPRLVLFGPSYDSRDVAGRLQALLGAALVGGADDLLAVDRVRVSVALSLWPGRPGNLRGGIGGTKHVEVSLDATPGLVVARSGAFAAEPCGGTATAVEVAAEVPDTRRRVRRVTRHEESGGNRLEDALVVVAGGRGLGDAETFALLDDLATSIGNAAVGATRPVVDAGWVPYARQIGRTGKSVRPRVYIAVGVSGASQHVIGVRGAGTIVAVNIDPAAPILALADLGVVGDASTVVNGVIDRLAARGAERAST